MKKILLLMAIILPFVLSSCGDDNDEPKQNLEQELIGGWVMTEYGDDNSSISYSYIFNSDHTGKDHMFVDMSLLDETNFTWTLEGNILTFNYLASYGESTKQVEISIKDDILYVKVDDRTFELHRAKG